MIPILLFLKYLLFMELGTPAVDFQTEHCFVMKSGVDYPFGNRICNWENPSDDEIDQVLGYMRRTPCYWFVDAKDTETIRSVQKKGLRQSSEYPAMAIDLRQVKPIAYPPEVEVRKITNQADVITWISIVARAFPLSGKGFTTFVRYILKRAKPGIVNLYLAYFNGVPVASNMTIRHGDVVSVHWIATLQDYRGKGIGTAVSHKPLLDARAAGCKQAILFATEMGKPVYAKLGYKEYAHYKVFKR